MEVQWPLVIGPLHYERHPKCGCLIAFIIFTRLHPTGFYLESIGSTIDMKIHILRVPYNTLYTCRLLYLSHLGFYLMYECTSRLRFHVTVSSCHG